MGKQHRAKSYRVLKCIAFAHLELNILGRVRRRRVQVDELVVEVDEHGEQGRVQRTEVHANHNVARDIKRDTTNQAEHDDARGVGPLVGHVDTDKHLLLHAGAAHKQGDCGECRQEQVEKHRVCCAHCRDHCRQVRTSSALVLATRYLFYRRKRRDSKLHATTSIVF